MSITYHDLPQYSEEWWEVRRGVPTASNFSSMMTPKKQEFTLSGSMTYAYQLCGERLSQSYGAPEENYQSAAMKQGVLMEPRVRAAYEFHTGHTVKPIGFVFNRDLEIGGSPDGLIGEDGGLECKYPIAKTMAQWMDTLTPQIPDEHKAQVHGSLIVSGRKWWDFMAWHDGFSPLIVRVEWDDYTDKLAACIDQFTKLYRETWARLIKLNPQPEPVANNPDDDLPPMF